MEQVRERTLEVLDEIELDPERRAARGRLRLRDAARPRVPAQRDDAAAAADGRGLRAGRDRRRPRCRGGRRRARRWSGSRAGSHEIGAPAVGFAYDNERPRHRVELEPFLIDRTPVTNARLHRLPGGDRRRAADVLGARWGGGLGPHRDGEDRGGRSAPAGDPRLLARGRCLRPLGGQAAAHRARVGGGRGRQPIASAPTSTSSPSAARRRGRTPTLPPTAVRCRCWATSGSGRARTSPPTPASRPFPTPSTPRSSSATRYKVLRGGAWATRRDVIRTSFRNWDLPSAARSSPASAAPAMNPSGRRGRSND